MLFIKKIVCSVLIGVLLVGLCQAYRYTGDSAQSTSLALPHNIGKQKEEMTYLLQEKKRLEKLTELNKNSESAAKNEILKLKLIQYIFYTISALCFTCSAIYLFLSAIIGGGIIIYVILYFFVTIYLGWALEGLYSVCKDIKYEIKMGKIYKRIQKYIILELDDIQTQIQQINSQNHILFINSLKHLEPVITIARKIFTIIMDSFPLWNGKKENDVRTMMWKFLIEKVMIKNDIPQYDLTFLIYLRQAV